ncbi:TIGR03016 family PEP-CTERM system-associated outer membrane protein [Zoogloea sp.]|uniref:TIGR03016 family PEP-CTERM system-associated outer membrane protein n=1 Tax=Zoogloea sp. TaxID=49181 RepID=UPI0014165E5B|nr:MAG: TIGR03016 family PEP-CTERM system-associated outer membrane protein [Zoogloea sp.]
MKIRPSGSIRPAGRWRAVAILLPISLPLGFASSQVLAQEQVFRVVPSVRLTETVTDNVGLSGVGGSQGVGSGKSESDWITLIAPSVRMEARGARLQGNLSLGVNSTWYANDSSRNQNMLSLVGSGKLEAWEKRAFIDVRSSISRELLSVLGPRPADQVTGTSNQAEVRNLNISPYVVGRFGDSGSMELRYTSDMTETDNAAAPRSVRQVWSASATDPQVTGRLGWVANFSDTQVTSDTTRDTKQQIARLIGLVRLDPQLQLRLITGSESNNLASVNTTRNFVSGIGLDWTPSPITRVGATWEDRFFGPGYLISAEHRRARSAFRFSFSKDVSSISQSLVSGVTLYDLLMLQYAAQYPDVNARDTFVRNLMANQAPGVGNPLVGAQAVLTNGLFLDRRVQFGMNLSGVRNSLSLTTYRSERTSLTDRSYALTGDFSSGSTVTDLGGSLIVNHQLTPSTSANLILNASRSRNDQTATGTQLSTRTRMISTGLTTSFSKKLNGSLMLRNNQSSGSTDYKENAVIGSLSLQF